MQVSVCMCAHACVCVTRNRSILWINSFACRDNERTINDCLSSRAAQSQLQEAIHQIIIFCARLLVFAQCVTMTNQCEIVLYMQNADAHNCINESRD